MEPEHEGYGTFECPCCHRLYKFRWDGQMWTFSLLKEMRRDADLIIPPKPPKRTPENDEDNPEHKTHCPDLKAGKECSHRYKRPWKKA